MEAAYGSNCNQNCGAISNLMKDENHPVSDNQEKSFDIMWR